MNLKEAFEYVRTHGENFGSNTTVAGALYDPQSRKFHVATLSFSEEDFEEEGTRWVSIFSVSQRINDGSGSGWDGEGGESYEEFAEAIESELSIFEKMPFDVYHIRPFYPPVHGVIGCLEAMHPELAYILDEDLEAAAISFIASIS